MTLDRSVQTCVQVLRWHLKWLYPESPGGLAPASVAADAGVFHAVGVQPGRLRASASVIYEKRVRVWRNAGKQKALLTGCGEQGLVRKRCFRA